MEVKQLLIDAARQAQCRAIVPYSHFKVGAAALTEDGRIFSGCNIESSSYGLTICAERVALFKALSEGATKIFEIAIYTETDEFCPPCGACRQLLWDFAPQVKIILANKQNHYQIFLMTDLYPHAFGSHFLENY